MIHITNWIVNGIPERFPKLKVIWIESGLAWVPFLMQRLDNEYMMRTSEAPLLKQAVRLHPRHVFHIAAHGNDRHPGRAGNHHAHDQGRDPADVFLNIANEQSLKTKRAAIEKFMRIYARAIDWAYANQAAVDIFADNMKLPSDIAKKAVAEFYPKAGLQIGEIKGLELTLQDALDYKI